MPDNVDILLSVYNGGKYLQQQLQSIVLQSHQHWHLLIRDDGSNDDSVEIIEQFKTEYPDRVKIITDQQGNIGYSASFTELLKHSMADYIMFCDQDDIWYSNKIAELLLNIKREEGIQPGKAVLVFSDLDVINDKMEVVTTFNKHFKFKKGVAGSIFFLKNYIPGCNMLFNRILLKSVFKTTNVIGYYDYWLVLVCATIGKITYIDKPLMKYRLHSNNAIGLKIEEEPLYMRLSTTFKTCLKYCFRNKEYRDIVYSKNIEQINNVCQVFPALAVDAAKQLVSINTSNFFVRKRTNILAPYITERYLAEQLTYIICF